ncbi:methyl-accepting chemotaxis protein [Paragemmobacter straminiformis]|uniref:Methyl-accepting chemotaxis protein n=1 Tax=Paragemmobacter straminiformis TaxID=2045119 RepID=A0A842I4X6_9RHOB|nr:methyl-accepting chemotaxis protein [Gemmobacter straminiformis]MBC2834706.1 methyl-accepting chemotaxis protein [Gemmobacter straminiformis]
MSELGNAFAATQAEAARKLVWAAAVFLPVTAASGWAVGNGFAAALVSAGFLALGLSGQRQAAPVARVATALAVIGQPVAMTAALAGHPWQVDLHMLFFAAMAALVAMTDMRALLVAAGLVVLHHLVLSVAWPVLVYPSIGLLTDIERTLMHGAILAGETAALLLAVHRVRGLIAEAEARQEKLAETMAQVHRAEGEAVAALRLAEAAKAAAEVQAAHAEQAQAEMRAEQARAAAAAETVRLAEARQEQIRAEAAAKAAAAVEALRAGLSRLSSGDLKVTIHDPLAPEYEGLRVDFNQAAAMLAGAIGRLSEVTGQIRSEARAINEAAGDLARRTERQAATLEQTSAAMTELTTTVQASAALAVQAEGATDGARRSAVQGSEVVGQAIGSMNRISESATKIARITDVIGEIAFQTNLLALNAGVEAARAGEAGRGFAVVASEVRALAQRCSDAAKEINQLIEESGEQVRDGVLLVGRTGEALGEITTSVQEMAGHVATIARSAESQSRGLAEMNAAIADLDRVTQQNASMFEETSAACQTLVSVTDEMQGTVAQFRVQEEAPLSFRRRA